MKVTVNSILDPLTPVGISQLGTLMFDNIVFPAGKWIDNELNTQTYKEVKFDAVTLSFNRIKEIVTSQVSGISGTINEYVTHGDYVIDISAIIAPAPISAVQIAQVAAGLLPGVSEATGAVGGNAVAEPVELLTAIAELEKVPNRVEIRSKILQNYLGVTYVIIDEMPWSKISADSWRVDMKLRSSFDIDMGDFG